MRIRSLLIVLASAMALSTPAKAELITAERVFTLQTHGGRDFEERDKYTIWHASDGDAGTTWCTQNPNGGNNYYLNGRENPIMVFDLGTNQILDAFSIWGYPVHGNSLQKFTLSFYDGSQGFDTPIAVQDVTLDTWTANATNVALAAPVTAQYVKMEMTGNFGQTVGGGDRVGIADLQFNRTNTIETYTPSSATANNAIGNMPATNLLDGNTSTQWCTDWSQGGNIRDYYHDGKYADPELTFTFNEAKNLSSITVTPYNVTGNSGKDFNLKFYDAAGNQIAVEDESLYSFKMVTYRQDVPSLFTFPEVKGAAKVVMTITDNFRGDYDRWGGDYDHNRKYDNDGGDRVGLSEVSFGNHPYTGGPTWQTSYNTPMEGLNVIRPDGVSIKYPSGSSVGGLITGSGYSRGGAWYSDQNGSDFFGTDTTKATPVLTFTNDELELVDGFLYWGYGSENAGNGMTAFTLSLYDGEELVLSDYYRVDAAISEDDYASFMFDESVAFDKAVLIPMDNAFKYFNYAGHGGDRVGFSGLAFYQDPAKVPEPAAWVLLLTGAFGLLTLRNRKRTQNA